MSEMPDKIKRIDILRVEYGKRKLCECLKPHYEIDWNNKIVTCTDCSAIVDPLEALHEIAKDYNRIGDQVETLLEQRRQIVNYKPHLIVLKNLESHYRSHNYSMVPICPHCHEPFDLSELTSWCNRSFLKVKE